MKELLVLATGAILVESLVEIIKSVYNERKINLVVITSILVGLLIAFTLDLDLFKLLGLNAQIDYVGLIATGMIISRGSNYVHDLLATLGNGFNKNTEKEQ